MNAIELLKDDHDRVDRLFQKVKATEEGEEHKKLFEKIKEEFLTHAHLEEAIFYPQLKKNEKTKDITLEGVEEHHQAKILIRELSGLSKDSEKFEPKLKVLIEDIQHHVQEEEGEMFPKVKKIMSETELEELGREMEKERKAFQKSYAAGK